MKSGLAAAMLVAVLVACDEGPPPGPDVAPPPDWTRASTREADALANALETTEPGAEAAPLSVQLAFGANADLDLYVTDPLGEAVYYANTPSEIGGALVEDRRCVHDAPRIETVRFTAPLTPGRYRIGVDYPHACTEPVAAVVPFAIRVGGPGAVRARSRGLARYRAFEPIVLEFDVDRAGGVIETVLEEAKR